VRRRLRRGRRGKILLGGRSGKKSIFAPLVKVASAPGRRKRRRRKSRNLKVEAEFHLSSRAESSSSSPYYPLIWREKEEEKSRAAGGGIIGTSTASIGIIVVVEVFPALVRRLPLLPSLSPSHVAVQSSLVSLVQGGSDSPKKSGNARWSQKSR
jgi:hypothetical protein